MFIDMLPVKGSGSRFIGETTVALLKEFGGHRKTGVSIDIAPRRGFADMRPAVTAFLLLLLILASSSSARAQNPAPNTETPKKTNTRPSGTATIRAEPFDGASIEKMAGQCVRLETEQGAIMIEMLPAKAPESARNFLNLAATGAFDTTVFSRVVPGFVIQGGDLSTSERWSQQLANRSEKRLPDEPSDVKHVRASFPWPVPKTRTAQPLTFSFWWETGHTSTEVFRRLAGCGRVSRWPMLSIEPQPKTKSRTCRCASTALRF